jgi:hypothetical protein
VMNQYARRCTAKNTTSLPPYLGNRLAM